APDQRMRRVLMVERAPASVVIQRQRMRVMRELQARTGGAHRILPPQQAAGRQCPGPPRMDAPHLALPDDAGPTGYVMHLRRQAVRGDQITDDGVAVGHELRTAIDHATIVTIAGHATADAIGRFQHDHIDAARGKMMGGAQARDAAADHDRGMLHRPPIRLSANPAHSPAGSTDKTSSTVVRPRRTCVAAEMRSGCMPSSRAKPVKPARSSCGVIMPRRRGLTVIISYTPVRPRYPVLRHSRQPTGSYTSVGGGITQPRVSTDQVCGSCFAFTLQCGHSVRTSRCATIPARVDWIR